MEDKLTINKAYAAKYQKRKRAEELSRRKCRNIAMNDPSLKCRYNHAVFHYVDVLKSRITADVLTRRANCINTLHSV